jgi:hypothetical protein
VVTFAYNANDVIYKCNITYNPALRNPPYDLFYSDSNNARCCTHKRGDFLIGLTALIFDVIIGNFMIVIFMYAIYRWCSRRTRPEPIEKSETIPISRIELSSRNIVIGTYEKGVAVIVNPS